VTTQTPPDASTTSGTVGRWLDSARRFTVPALVANLVAQIVIVGTGGAVRLTGSGLGCSTWPLCEPGEFTPKFHEATSLHPFIEFGNRTLTGVLGVIAIVVAVLVWRARDRSRAFRVLGLVPLLGVVFQAVLGGITVLVELHPAVVGSHLLVSMALVAVSAVLLDRAREGDGRPKPLVGPRTRVVSWLLMVALVPVLVLGVVVTGAGPHSGDSEVGYRFAVDPAHVTQFHSASVWVFTALLVTLLVLVYRTSPRVDRARRVVLVLLVVTLAQGAIGYVQYFTGLPELLVGAHMVGAALLTAGAARVPLALRSRA
jgi:cytochrome c oxidase assembly protein subunit 15